MSVTGPSFHALSADTISKMMFDIVDEVNVVFQLPTPYVRLLLIACKWDKEKLLERSVGRGRTCLHNVLMTNLYSTHSMQISVSV